MKVSSSSASRKSRPTAAYVYKSLSRTFGKPESGVVRTFPSSTGGALSLSLSLSLSRERREERTRNRAEKEALLPAKAKREGKDTPVSCGLRAHDGGVRGDAQVEPAVVESRLLEDGGEGALGGRALRDVRLGARGVLDQKRQHLQIASSGSKGAHALRLSLSLSLSSRLSDAALVALGARATTKSR